ncbi:MAG: class I SAM-dependent methyltransferase [Candidatus Dormibacteria bacterium]
MSDAENLSAHAVLNRAYWNEIAPRWVDPGQRAWAGNEISWGIWRIPEAAVGALPTLEGRDVIELGCGTGYVSSWLARRGARPVGIDNSPQQLRTARAFQEEFGVDFPLLLGSAESVPRADASFDLAVSEYGASLWCDPAAWIPEAARLLRPGGRLVFLSNSVLLTLCVGWDDTQPAGTELRIPQFGLYRMQWEDGDVPSVEFHVPHGEMIRILRQSGFEILALHELRAPEAATSTWSWVTADWARQWPSEEMWVAEKKP